MFHSSAQLTLIIKKRMKTKKVMMMVMISLFSIITKSTPCTEKTKGHTVTATMYHPVKGQCYGNPLITADGSKINLGDLKSGKTRWIAISRDLLKHYKYGDTVMVISENSQVSGKWVIHDTMSSRYSLRIDFLCHPSSSYVIPRSVTIHHV